MACVSAFAFAWAVAACGTQGDQEPKARKTPSATTSNVTPTAGPGRAPSGQRTPSPSSPTSNAFAPTGDPTKFGECLGKPPTLVGTRGDDTIIASKSRDVILARGGNDHITGLGLFDRVCTGKGDDLVDHDSPTELKGTRVDTGPGDDTVTMRSAKDLYTGPGDDTISIRFTRYLFTGPGNDRVSLSFQAQFVGLGVGDDRFKLVGRADGVQKIRLAGGNDQVIINSRDPHVSARTCVIFARSTRDMHVNLLTGTVRSTHPRADRINLHKVRCIKLGGGHNVVRGTDYSDVVYMRSNLPGELVAHTAGSGDVITGGPGNDRIYSDRGMDSVSTGDGDDLVYAGSKDDSVEGGAGNDRIYGGRGHDYLYGGKGVDLIVGHVGSDDVFAGNGCSPGIHHGGGGLADAQPNNLYGGLGDDYLSGDKGADRLDGGAGKDAGNGGWLDAGNNVIVSVERLFSGCGEGE